MKPKKKEKTYLLMLNEAMSYVRYNDLWVFVRGGLVRNRKNIEHWVESLVRVWDDLDTRDLCGKQKLKLLVEMLMWSNHKEHYIIAERLGDKLEELDYDLRRRVQKKRVKR